MSIRPDLKRPDDPAGERSIARNCVVPDDMMTRLIPAFETLYFSKSDRIRKAALAFIPSSGSHWTSKVAPEVGFGDIIL